MKRLTTEALKEENYNETLAYIATRILSKKTIEAKEAEAERIDSILWRLARTEKANTIDEAQDNAIRFTVALDTMITDCYRNL